MNAQHTPAMIRELKSIATNGEPTDLIEWHAANALWFHARDKVLGALLRRQLIEDGPNGYAVTDAGRTVLTNANGVAT